MLQEFLSSVDLEQRSSGLFQSRKGSLVRPVSHINTEHMVSFFSIQLRREVNSKCNSRAAAPLVKWEEHFQSPIIFFKYSLFLKRIFIYSWERKREAETQAEREKQAPRRKPNAGLDPGTLGSCCEPKADTQPLSYPGIPQNSIIKKAKEGGRITPARGHSIKGFKVAKGNYFKASRIRSQRGN